MFKILFVNDITLFENVCDNYDATPEEMLELLANASYKNVAFLDELIQYSYKYIEDNKFLGNLKIDNVKKRYRLGVIGGGTHGTFSRGMRTKGNKPGGKTYG